jgi:hypothetical protein
LAVFVVRQFSRAAKRALEKLEMVMIYLMRKCIRPRTGLADWALAGG